MDRTATPAESTPTATVGTPARTSPGMLSGVLLTVMGALALAGFEVASWQAVAQDLPAGTAAATAGGVTEAYAAAGAVEARPIAGAACGELKADETHPHRADGSCRTAAP